METLINKLSKHIEPDRIFTDSLEWKEDLIWCPSQCSFYFRKDGVRHELYLRWRHSDPWTLDLIIYPPDSEDSHWIEISEMPDFKASELKEAETWALEWLLSNLENKNL